LDELVPGSRRTICLYTYATGAKIYPPSWWEELYERLQKRWPEYNIIELLPVENVSQLSFRIPSLYSKDLRLIGSFLANTAIFIGADSGMMHLASASGVPTVGLFKTTNMEVYAPYNDHSVGVNTDRVGMEGCLHAIKTILETDGKPVARTSRH
jgi:ADP-heptose:LPS heptosyltransferase